MSVVAPYVPTYSSRTPYLTVNEYLASAAGVDTSQLIVNGTPGQNADALTQKIAGASSVVDGYCKQILGATVDTQSGQYRVTRDGYLRIPVDYTPIVQVNSIQVGWQPSTMFALTDLTNVWLSRKVVQVPIANLSFPTLGVTQYRPFNGQMLAIIQYVNGYANTTLSAAATSGQATITVSSTLGIVAGIGLTLYDSGESEQVTVLSVSGNVLTLTGNLLNNHAVGVAVSAMPNAIKQATAFLTSALIKTRGSEAIVLAQLGGQPSHTEPIEDGGLEDIAMAKDLLQEYLRVS